MISNLPVLLLKSLVLLPHQEVKLELNNELSKKIINLASKNHKGQLLIACPKDQFEENPEVGDLPEVGVVGLIKSRIELPNGNYRVVISGVKRIKVKFYANYILDNEVLEANTVELDLPKFDVVEEMALRRKIVELVEEYISIARYLSNSFLMALKKCDNLNDLTDMVIAHIPFSIDKKILYMEEINPLHRANALIVDLNVELQVLELDQRIEENLRLEFEKNQKEYVLKEKIREIQKELGEEDPKDNVVKDYLDLLNDLDINPKTREKFLNEIKKFEYTNDASPEASTIRNYLDLVLNLPWNRFSVDETDLTSIKKELDNSHFGLDKIKERIIEYIAVKNRNRDLKTPILCFVGPPGVGKTSLAKSIARALNREFYKISVGGLNDSSELIGHRRTYIGSCPGKIIQGIKKCGVSNPLVLIDEVDKMVRDYKGDPSSTLLDILDVEQNNAFIDNYVEEPFDLSKVLFILTANDISLIPPALYDRLEIVELASYTEFEKLDIATKYLLPSIFDEHLVSTKEVKINNDIIMEIIKKYTREAGVRDLRRQLEVIVRKIVTKSVINDEKIKVTIKKKDLVDYLGNEKFDDFENVKYKGVGIVNALAYTPLGGVVMQIEANMYEGSGKRIITGSLGQVMSESIDVAISYIRNNKEFLKVNDYYFDKKDIHLHFLEGAIKKDGPSAGMAIVTALLSLILSKNIDWTISMTGEIGLKGEILKIGGLKEKIIGAYNGGIKKIFIPKSNVGDLSEIPSQIIDKIEIIPVKNYSEVYKFLFEAD